MAVTQATAGRGRALHGHGMCTRVYIYTRSRAGCSLQGAYNEGRALTTAPPISADTSISLDAYPFTSVVVRLGRYQKKEKNKSTECNRFVRFSKNSRRARHSNVARAFMYISSRFACINAYVGKFAHRLIRAPFLFILYSSPRNVELHFRILYPRACALHKLIYLRRCYISTSAS